MLPTVLIAEPGTLRKGDMPTDEQAEQREQKRQDRKELLALIARQVTHALGQPDRLHRINVRRLWKNHYRANVLVGPDATSMTIANSFVLVTDDAGYILESAPDMAGRLAPTRP